MEIVNITNYNIKILKLNDDVDNIAVSLDLTSNNPESIIVIHKSNNLNYTFDNNKLIFGIKNGNKNDIIKIIYK